MKRLKKWILILIIIIILVAGIIALIFLGGPLNKKSAGSNGNEIATDEVLEDFYAQFGEVVIDSPIKLSHTEHFYSSHIEVAITTDMPCKIYYTLDGSPATDASKEYTKPFELNCRQATHCYPLSIVAYPDDGSNPYYLTHSYLIGKDIETRFDTYVFCITVDPYSLWDYEYGIFTPGKLQEEYLAEHPGTVVDYTTPGNYYMRGRASEREMYIETFTPDGTCIISQNAGMRTYGGASRASAQKSVKIFARSSYDSEHKYFSYPFFPDVTTPDGSIGYEFNRLVLRNCGNDNGYAFLRDEMVQRLLKQAGYLDTQGIMPCALFINGDYFGFYWLHENYNGSYFKTHYGKHSGDFIVLEGGETYKNPSDDVDEPHEAARLEYNEMYNYYSRQNLTDNAVYEELCKVLDVENYLDYYAVNIYIDNEDWPQNNYKCYRYYPDYKDGEMYPTQTDGTVFDGRWRYLPHDMDFTFSIYGASYKRVSFKDLASSDYMNTKKSPLFAALMKRGDCKQYFINQILSLANVYFSGENIDKTLTAMHEERLNEQMHSYDTGYFWSSPDDLAGAVNVVRQYAYSRQNVIIDYFADYYNYSAYGIHVTASDGNQVLINGDSVANGFTGSYYYQLDVRIAPDLQEGETFLHWELNGIKYNSEELTIDKKDIIDGDLNIVLVTE